MTAPARRLTRSTDDKWIGGVCGGLARYFGIDPLIVRLLFVLSCLLPGPQFVLYLILWLVIPARPAQLVDASDVKTTTFDR